MQSAQQSRIPDRDQGVSAPRCKGIEYVQVCTSNVVQAAYFYRSVFGFRPTAVSPVQTGARDAAAILLRAGHAQLLLSSPLRQGSIADHLSSHGEGVKDIALRVDDVRRTVDAASRAGATIVCEPEIVEAGSRSVTRAVVQTCGALQHTLLEYEGKNEISHTGMVPVNGSLRAPSRGIETIDHIAISVAPGTLNRYVDMYCNAFGLNVSHKEKVVTALSAMDSMVVQNSARTVTFSMIEPLAASRRSQVEEFLDYNHGPGAQHVAFLSRDIVRTVRQLRVAGIEFLDTPNEYYEDLPRRVGAIEEDLGTLRDLGILVDRDEGGYLLQIFSKPLQTVPTFFVEIIQRRGAVGFGSGNILALFQAMEREQAARRNL